MRTKFSGPSFRQRWVDIARPILEQNTTHADDIVLNVYFDIEPIEHFSLRLRRKIRRQTWAVHTGQRVVERDVLIRLEPKVVLPNTYNLKKADFDLVVDTGFRNQSPFAQPQLEESTRLRPALSQERQSKFCLIVANKFSPIKGELYSLRKEAALRFDDIALYGRQWDLALPQKLLTAAKALVFALPNWSEMQFNSLRIFLSRNPSSNGEVGEKSDTYQNYKYALVIENEKDYVSEKLYDALCSACIPVYVGPKVKEIEWLDRLIFRADADLVSIESAMKKALEVDYQTWLAELKVAFSQETFKDVHDQSVVTAISHSILDFLYRQKVLKSSRSTEK